MPGGCCRAPKRACMRRRGHATGQHPPALASAHPQAPTTRTNQHPPAAPAPIHPSTHPPAAPTLIVMMRSVGRRPCATHICRVSRFKGLQAGRRAGRRWGEGQGSKAAAQRQHGAAELTEPRATMQQYARSGSAATAAHPPVEAKVRVVEPPQRHPQPQRRLAAFKPQPRAAACRGRWPERSQGPVLGKARMQGPWIHRLCLHPQNARNTHNKGCPATTHLTALSGPCAPGQRSCPGRNRCRGPPAWAAGNHVSNAGEGDGRSGKDPAPLFCAWCVPALEAQPGAARPTRGTLCWERPIASTHVVRGPWVVCNVVQRNELALSGLAGRHGGEPSAADELQGLPHSWDTAAGGHRLLQRRQAGRAGCCRAAATAPELRQAAQQRCLSLPQHGG